MDNMEAGGGEGSSKWDSRNELESDTEGYKYPCGDRTIRTTNSSEGYVFGTIKLHL